MPTSSVGMCDPVIIAKPFEIFHSLKKILLSQIPEQRNFVVVGNQWRFILGCNETFALLHPEASTYFIKVASSPLFPIFLQMLVCF
jgi:hypothetical protein